MRTEHVISARRCQYSNIARAHNQGLDHRSLILWVFGPAAHQSTEVNAAALGAPQNNTDCHCWVQAPFDTYKSLKSLHHGGIPLDSKVVALCRPEELKATVSILLEGWRFIPGGFGERGPKEKAIRFARSGLPLLGICLAHSLW